MCTYSIHLANITNEVIKIYKTHKKKLRILISIQGPRNEIQTMNKCTPPRIRHKMYLNFLYRIIGQYIHRKPRIVSTSHERFY